MKQYNIIFQDGGTKIMEAYSFEYIRSDVVSFDCGHGDTRVVKNVASVEMVSE